MQIDWVTVTAQIVNFLVLVWLLKRFLYRPITEAMARREAAIKAKLDEAARMKAEADKRAADLAREQQELEAKRQSLLTEARSEADALKRKLTTEARGEVEQKRKAWHDELSQGRDEFLATISNEATSGFQRLAGDALKNLADENLADRFALVLSRRLGDLPKADVARMSEALAGNGGRLVVEAPAEISAASRKKLDAAIRAALGKSVKIEYAAARGDLTGIRLRAHGETIEWTLGDYVARYTQKLAEAFPGEAEADLG